AVTTKRLAFKSAIGELVGFLSAAHSAADFRALGCRVWDQNANENQAWLDSPWRQGPDDLGPVYGVQWRRWPAYKLLPADAQARIQDAQANGYRVIGPVQDPAAGAAPQLLLYKAVDQLRRCLDALVHDPGSRR